MKKFFCRRKELNSFHMIHDWKRTEGTFDFVCSLLYRLTISSFSVHKQKIERDYTITLILQHSEYVFVHIFDDIFGKRSVHDLITGFKRDSTICHRCTCYSCIMNERLTRRARVYRVTVTQMRAHVPYKTCPDLFCSSRNRFYQNICIFEYIYFNKINIDCKK